jgi:SCF-associated factor 1
LTWGQFSSGALGHGSIAKDGKHKPKFVETLSEKFVFTIGFGGWQSSALAVDKEFYL